MEQTNSGVFQRAKTSLSDPFFKTILKCAGSFHDARIASSQYVDANWMLEIVDIYFPVERKYNIFSTSGCVMYISNCIGLTSSTVMEVIERELFELKLNGDKISMVFSFDGMEISNLKFDPRDSYFQWIFRD